MSKLNESQQKILENVAASLGTNAAALYRLIDFESKFDLWASNSLSSAKGLIQFTDSTARNLGYESSYDLVMQNPTIEDQLQGPVYQYLKPFVPLDSEQKLYMAVFYPQAISWPLNKEFPETVQKVNPGIKTVNDYIKKVDRFFDPRGAIIIVLGLAGILLYTIIQK